MYRLALYFLAGLALFSFVLSLTGVFHYNPWRIFLPAVYLTGLCYILNRFFGFVFKKPANQESAIITGLILSLITGPASLWGNLVFFSFIAFLAIFSKYFLTFRGRHIFNPAAFAVFASFMVLNQGASWWVGNFFLAPLVLVFGMFLARKIGSAGMIAGFLTAFLVLNVLLNPGIAGSFGSAFGFLQAVFIYSPLLFFAFIILPEPQTSPKRNFLKVSYGITVAVFAVFLQNFSGIPYSLELALLGGNFLTLAVSSDARFYSSFKGKEKLSKEIYGFWFKPDKKIKFAAGQFLEWSVYHKGADGGGIRRYFTIASSPTEKDILLSAKFQENPSSFKKALLRLKPGEKVTAAGPQGDFILPLDKNKKLVFIAGGIGITPFRSMVKHLLDSGEKRDIILLYAANESSEFIFRDIFEQAEKKFWLKTVYVITNEKKVPKNWQGEIGFITKKVIEKTISDRRNRLFYVSGPEPMVRAVANELLSAGISKNKIKRDYFQGYAEI